MCPPPGAGGTVENKKDRVPAHRAYSLEGTELLTGTHTTKNISTEYGKCKEKFSVFWENRTEELGREG